LFVARQPQSFHHVTTSIHLQGTLWKNCSLALSLTYCLKLIISIPYESRCPKSWTFASRSWVCSLGVLDSFSNTNIYHLENINALEPDLIKPEWVIYLGTRFTEDSVEKDDYTVALTLSDRTSKGGTRMFKDSGNTPELAYEALLRQLALELANSKPIPK